MGTWTRIDAKLVIDIRDFDHKDQYEYRYNSVHCNEIAEIIRQRIIDSFEKYVDETTVTLDSDIIITCVDNPIYETQSIDDYSDRHDVHLVDCTRKIVYITAYNRQLSPYQGVDWIRIVCDEVLYDQSSVVIETSLSTLLITADSVDYSYVYSNEAWNVVYGPYGNEKITEDHRKLIESISCPLTNHEYTP